MEVKERSRVMVYEVFFKAGYTSCTYVGMRPEVCLSACSGYTIQIAKYVPQLIFCLIIRIRPARNDRVDFFECQWKY
jgi:hypothetical protein